MKKRKHIRISICLLFIMVILGLIVIFTQVLDLKASNKISPSKRDIEKFVLAIEDVKRVYCIEHIKEVFYSKEDELNRRSLNPLRIEFQAVMQRGNDLSLKSSYLILTPKFHKERYGDWLRPEYKSIFNGWEYMEDSRLNKETYFKASKSLSLFESKKIKKCK